MTNEFKTALTAFIAAAEVMTRTWPDDTDAPDPRSPNAACYPTYLPSFDDFVADLRAWRDALEAA